MNATGGPPTTIGEVLFSQGDPAQGVEKELKEQAAGATLSSIAAIPGHLGGAAMAEIGSVISSFLRVDLVGVVAAGWKKHAELVDVARETLENEAEERIIDLQSHRIESEYSPSVDVYLDGIRVGKVDVHITVSVVLHAVSAVVAQGMLKTLRTGKAEFTVAMSCEGIAFPPQSREIDLALELPLGNGIALVEQAPTTAAEPVVVPRPDEPGLRDGH